MTDDRRTQAQRLFEAALGKEFPERAAFLEGLGATDPELRNEVEVLLASQGEEKLENPPAGAEPQTLEKSTGIWPSSKSADRPSRIGPYHILREIGEGGMGIVYEAEQEAPVHRKVALKLIKWGMDTKAVVARFESERQALALMNHPNIASVHDAGSTEQGRPFFAMELVHGEPITTYCDKHRLTLKERLDLFLQVCEGVQHAHQKGIIHRDIKPSNILVTILDDKPVPKIIDFGVAKATSQRLTEKTVYTELGQWVGTPEYMSPEQAEMTGLDIDTRTDVYSLGVLLYELLSGAQPFDATELRRAGFDGIRRILREEEPPKPSTKVHSLGKTSTDSAKNRRVELPTLERELRGDLDWITMKALDKDRTRRYGSPSDLAEDIRRHLRHEPVLASPPSQAYRLGKFTRRHRLGVSAAAALVLVLAGVAVLMTVQSARIAHERDRAEQEAAKAKAVNNFVQQMLGAANPYEGMGQEVTVVETLDEAMARLGRSFENQPDVKAAIENTIGLTYFTLGRYEAAEPLLTSALETRRRNFGGDHLDVAESLVSLGQLREVQGAYDAAEALFQEALTIRRRLLGEDHLEVASVLEKLALVYSGRAEIDDAETMFRQALAMRRRLGDSTDAITVSLDGLARQLGRKGEKAEAERLYLESLDRRREVLGEEHPKVSEALNNLALFYRDMGDLDAAEKYMREAVALNRKLWSDTSPEIAVALYNLASVLNEAGAYEQAEAPARESVTLLEGTPDALALDRGIASRVLADALNGLAEYQESEQRYLYAMEQFRKILGEDHVRTALCRRDFGRLLVKTGRYEEAEAELLFAAPILRTRYGEHHRHSQKTLRYLIDLYKAWGKPEKAAEYRAMLETKDSQ